MKTPHVINALVGSGGAPRYDPLSDSFWDESGVWTPLACLVDVPRDATVLEQYGTRGEMDIIVRFLSTPPEFEVAEWNGNRYTVVDRSPSGKKQSLRMRRVAR